MVKIWNNDTRALFLGGFAKLFLCALMMLTLCSIDSSASEEQFALGKSEGDIEIWMVGNRPRNVYFQEFLPALFERTLRFSEFAIAGETFEWLFTGDKGGFTISVTDSTISVTQRFYDSFGLHQIDKFYDKDQPADFVGWFDNSVSLHLFPEKKWFSSSSPIGDTVKSISVILDYKLGLSVIVNGELVIRQTCLMDVQRHQLKASATDVSIRGMMAKPDPVQAVVTVDESRIHQEMIGFGGTCIPTAYAQLTDRGKQEWWRLICEYNLLVQRENPIGESLDRDMSNWDVLDDATPHYYGDNFPNGNISNFSYNRKIKSLGGEVWFEFWSFPKWAYEEHEWTDNKGRTRPTLVNIESYLRAMIGYCNASAEKAGSPPDIVGIQNEQTQLPETYHAMTLGLRKALDHAGYSSVKIHMSNANMMTPESAWGKQYANSIARARSFLKSPEAWDAIDYSATNMYDYQQYFNKPDEFDTYLRQFRDLTADKPFLSTEMCVNNPRFQRSTYRLALLMGQLYHKNLTIADASAILYCWTLVNVEQPSFGWSRALFVPDRSNAFMPVASSNQLRVYGAYSRRIRKGMVRVEVETGSADLLASAFIGNNGEKTMVLLNRSTTPYTLSAGNGDGYTFYEIADPYHQNEVLDISEENRTIILPPGAVLTMSNVALGELPEGFSID